MATTTAHGESGTKRTLKCVVVTPEKAVVDATCDFAALPLYDGQLGVLPGRLPLIGRLGFGELRLESGDQTQHIYIDGGFVQIRNNTITVLTRRAIKGEDISLAHIDEAMQEAKRVATTDEGIEANLQAQQRARAQRRIAEKIKEEKPLIKGTAH